ncbi:hypothetical protein [Rhodosalinus sp. 5P4]|uniref:hypothetical protein n=1 Tax=Rhodosalinus sp. 5P4 TaxID=3239196 RepID=UPI0035249A95
MTKGAKRQGASGPPNEGREERLKAALKANIARRKAQARARDDAARDDGDDAARNENDTAGTGGGTGGERGQ